MLLALLEKIFNGACEEIVAPGHLNVKELGSRLTESVLSGRATNAARTEMFSRVAQSHFLYGSAMPPQESQPQHSCRGGSCWGPAANHARK